ncbi:hypothetical protein [Nocardia sp. GCM10030253]|uniref:hypothetical protein n=1 Tax=Nocardia sp. GCM10030253 TaxID=3273404 RepID=UPI00366C9839
MAAEVLILIAFEAQSSNERSESVMELHDEVDRHSARKAVAVVNRSGGPAELAGWMITIVTDESDSVPPTSIQLPSCVKQFVCAHRRR